MSTLNSAMSVAVVGAGMAGAACAASLQRAGLRVTLFEKSRGLGGRMATRRVRWLDVNGTEQVAEFDHGAQHFNAHHPRFRAVVARAQAAGVVASWGMRVHGAFPVAAQRTAWVAAPHMTDLCRHVSAGVPVRLQQPVQRLLRAADGWHLAIEGGETCGAFDQVMLATPAAQAAVLLAGHRDDWAEALMAVPMQACWTLLAATDDVDWPWDAAQPVSGPLAWLARNDRKPGRRAPRGVATWVAQATPAWTALHLDADPLAVAEALRCAMAALLPAGRVVGWHHSSVHRWRDAAPAARVAGDDECWWDAALGLGVCGDSFGGGTVESAWRSGDELADTVAYGLEAVAEAAEAS